MPATIPYPQVTPQQFGAVGDGVTDDSAAFNAAITFLASVRTSPTGYTSWGVGHLHVPKGKYLCNSTISVTGGKGLGLLITGEGMWATSIITTNLSGTLFDFTTHVGVTIRELSFIHGVTKSVNPEPAWTNKCFALSNTSGGRAFSLEAVMIHGFDRQISIETANNGDNIHVYNCSFFNFNTHYYNAISTQTLNTTYSDTMFTGMAKRAFDVIGGPLTLHSCSSVIDGTFLHLRNTAASYGNSSKYVLENVNLEWGPSYTAAGLEPMFINVEGANVAADIFLKGCKVTANVVAHADAVWLRIAGPVRVWIEGGSFERKIELVGFTINTYARQSYVEFDGTALVDVANFLTLTAGPSGSSYSQVILKHCPGLAELTLAYDNSHVIDPRKVVVITDLIQPYMKLRDGATTPQTFSYPFFNMPCRIRKIELHTTRRVGTGAKVFTVYSDAARTVLIGTATVTTGTATVHEFYDFAVAANTVVTEGLFFSSTNADNNTLLGNIIIEYDCIGYRNA